MAQQAWVQWVSRGPKGLFQDAQVTGLSRTKPVENRTPVSAPLCLAA